MSPQSNLMTPKNPYSASMRPAHRKHKELQPLPNPTHGAHPPTKKPTHINSPSDLSASLDCSLADSQFLQKRSVQNQLNMHIQALEDLTRS